MRLVWIGRVDNRSSTLCSESLTTTELTFAGLEGDDHGGLTRPACVRTEQLYDEGVEIRNTRQVSVVSREEVKLIAGEIGIYELSPSLLGANIMLEGIPGFTLLPPSSRLQFNSGATLVVDMINLPCNLPAREIEQVKKGCGRHFKQAARNRRGVTCWVEREGGITVGDSIRLFMPDQMPWPGHS